MTQFKKPANILVLTKLKEELFNACSLVKQKDFKAPPNHIGLVVDSMSLFGAVMLPQDDTAKDYLKEIHESLPFLSNKILKLDKEADTKWVEAFMAVCKAHFAFVHKRYDAIHTWTGTKDTGFEKAF